MSKSVSSEYWVIRGKAAPDKGVAITKYEAILMRQISVHGTGSHRILFVRPLDEKRANLLNPIVTLVVKC